MINAYVTLAQVIAYNPENELSTSTTWNTLITTLCTNCSRAFDTLTFRQPGAYFVTDDATNYYDGIPPTATDFITTKIVDEIAAAPTSVSVSMSGDPSAFVALSSADYFMQPYNATNSGKPYTKIALNMISGAYKAWPCLPRSIQVVGKFGYSTSVPADVQEAILMYVTRLFKKVQQNYQEVGTLLDTGQVMVGMKKDYDLNLLITYYKKSRLTRAS